MSRNYVLEFADEDTRNGVMQELKWLFDSVTAEQAERYYTRR